MSLKLLLFIFFFYFFKIYVFEKQRDRELPSASSLIKPEQKPCAVAKAWSLE